MPKLMKSFARFVQRNIIYTLIEIVGMAVLRLTLTTVRYRYAE